MVGKAREEKAGGGSSKRVESGRTSGKLLDNAYHSGVKKRNKEKETNHSPS